jgi:hypothetical protein
MLIYTDVSATVNWYTKYLGMKAETFTSATDPSAAPRTALKFGTHRLHRIQL